LHYHTGLETMKITQIDRLPRNPSQIAWGSWFGPAIGVLGVVGVTHWSMPILRTERP
jgi:hypothetical protein